MKIFITGLAGMIGFYSAKHLTNQGHEVSGIDNFNDYYDVELKKERARILKNEYSIDVIDSDIRTADYNTLLSGVDVVLHLAAYANPRHALKEPQLYIDTNITGTQRLIEGVERNNINNVVYASSSCVMHGQPLPWNEHDLPGFQNNPYGWSKRANECQFMHSNIQRHMGLRFFTVYGPYGRPDMALFDFTRKILAQETIELYNYGDMKRDFTYVEDIVQGIGCVIDHILTTDVEIKEIYNIGFGESVNLMDFLHHIEDQLGVKAITKLMPKHPADVPATWSDTTKIKKLGYQPTTDIASGVKKFVDWYKDYYQV
jgi:UDP-glucuronate 4-epimerase